MKEKDNNNKIRKTPLGIERRFDRFGDWLDGSWALRKANPVLNKYPASIAVLTWLMRIAVGCVFIVSGLSKGIDPWGSYYKTLEYLSAMHLPFEEWGNTVLTMVFALFSVEFLIGVSLITGSFRKAAPIMSALFMFVMLPLTLWIAVSDPVADCGCFGDYIVISNWATFIKNCLVSLAVVWLLKFNSIVPCLITPYLQWFSTVAAGAYIFVVGYIGYWQQPMVDFRPYKVGTRLLVEDDAAEFTPVYTFIYEKDGEQIEVGEDDTLPDESEGWKFVRRMEKGFVKDDNDASSGKTGNSDFRIWSEDGEEDVTESLVGYDRQLLLLVPDLSTLSMATSWKINKLYDMSKTADTEFFAVVAGSPAEIEEWRDLSSGQYPIYTAEDTSIKELARGNPALVRLEEGEIKWKSALSALNLSDSDSDDVAISTSPLKMNITGGEALKDLSAILIAVLAVLALASMLLRSSIASLFSRGIDAQKDEKQDREAP